MVIGTGTPNKQNAYSRMMDFENAMSRRRGRTRMERYRFALAYYGGENLPPDNVEQPLGINYLRAICDKHTHYLFGEWEKSLFKWRCEPAEDTAAAKRLALDIDTYARSLTRRNNGSTLFFDAALNASIFGDAVLRVYWDKLEERVRWESLLPEYCHFRWRINDVNEIIEVVIAYPIPRSEALAEFGSAGNVRVPEPLEEMSRNAMYWEYWTPWLYQAWVDDDLIRNEKNPYVTFDAAGNLLPGIVPFVHIPNIRAGGEFYGYNDCDGILNLQDELNRKLADEGDIINNFAHPVTIVNKFYGDTEELPVGPDQVWDLGREGEAKYLTWSGPAPETHEYIEKIIEILLDTSSMSPVAFGRHKGSQQSAIALAIEFLPVSEKARRKRSLWEIGLRKLLRTSLFVETRSGGSPPITARQLQDSYMEIEWFPIMPRDRLALVNETIVLVVNHLKSMEKALAELGELDPDGEIARIMHNLKDLVAIGVQLQGLPGGAGSSSLPEGGSDATTKGRPNGSTTS